LVSTNIGTPAIGSTVKVIDESSSNTVFEDTIGNSGHLLANLLSYNQTSTGKSIPSYTVVATLNAQSDTVENVIVFEGSSVTLTVGTPDWTKFPFYITLPGKYIIDLDTLQVDTTGVGFVRAGIWITTEPDSETATLGVDDVFIDGQGAHLIGVAPSNTTEFGVWFKNRMSTLDTTYRDTLVNLNVKKFKVGIAFRWIADGLIENCTIDSVQKGIELQSAGLNVRNLVKGNNVTNCDDRGINVRGSFNTIENNSVISEILKHGIYIDRNYSHGNIIRNNTVEGGPSGRNESGLMFDNSAYSNVAEGNSITNVVGAPGIVVQRGAHANMFTDNVVTDCNYGISFGSADSNRFVNTTITGSDIGVRAIRFNITSDPSMGNLIVDSEISNSATLDVLVSGGSTLTLSNTTFDTAKVSVLDSSYLGVGWHLNVTVTDGGSPVEGATVRVYSSIFTDLTYRESTNSAGMAFFNVPEYVIMNSGVISTSNYTVQAIVAGSDTITIEVIVTGNTDVTLELTGIGEDQGSGLPDKYALIQNYPNPFNPETTIRYQLPKASHVSLKVYNILGQLVAILVNEDQKAGYKKIVWNGRNRSNNQVGSGMYFYVLQADDFRDVKKMLLMK
jgi:parallel beta-helix repeat protein